MNEIIYVLINESMPGYVKIGKTAKNNYWMRFLITEFVPHREFTYCQGLSSPVEML